MKNKTNCWLQFNINSTYKSTNHFFVGFKRSTSTLGTTFSGRNEPCADTAEGLTTTTTVAIMGSSGMMSSGGSGSGGGVVVGVGWFMSRSSSSGGSVLFVVLSGRSRLIVLSSCGGGRGGAVDTRNVVGGQVNIQRNSFFAVTTGDAGLVTISANKRNKNEDIVAIDLLVATVGNGDVARSTVDRSAVKVNSLKHIS